MHDENLGLEIMVLREMLDVHAKAPPEALQRLTAPRSRR
jgi:hypothetical protein